MKKNSLWNKILLWGLVLFAVFGVIYYLIGYQNLRTVSYSEVQGISASQVGAALTDGVTVDQSYTVHADYMDGVTLRFGTYADTLTQGVIHVSFLSGDEELASASLDATSLSDNEDVFFDFGQEIPITRGGTYIIRVWETEVGDTQAAAIWTTDAGDGTSLSVSGSPMDDVMIYFVPSESREGHFNAWFGGVFAGLLILFVCVCLVSMRHEARDEKTPLTEIVHIFDQYSFLLRQLIDKEFAVKYRRSYLGIVWVVLNPLLTMILMSAVFSTIFRQSIENFPVYLIVGQVAFNFFNEATNNSLPTIVNSSSMIKKIYVPKYIFPLSKVMFSFVNYVITFIPVALVMIFYHIVPTINLLYLPLIMLALFMFSLGVSFILSTAMVFMRDTQYLYGLVTTLLSFLTPIFYSIDNFDATKRFIMSLNPLYQYLSIVRTCVFYGQTPTVQSVLICLVLGIVFLWIGIEYFFRKQDKFILYI